MRRSGRSRLGLLSALGSALWTGVVVAAFVQIIPEIKRRQFMQALDADEAAQRQQAHTGSGQASRKLVACR